MKIITFTYKDAKGKVSERVLLPTIRPADFYTGTDLTELSDAEVVNYVRRRELLQDEYLMKITELNKELDVNYKYRKFLESNILNLVEEDI